MSEFSLDRTLEEYSSLADLAMESALSLLSQMRESEIVRWKGQRDFATEADIVIEAAVKDFFSCRTPEVGFWAEEENSGIPSQKLFWVLDPVDGTVNFSRNHPNYGISLALSNQDGPLIGKIAFPALGLRFSAVRGGGCFCNDVQCFVAENNVLSNAMVGFGDFAVSQNAEIRNVHRFEAIQKLGSSVLRVRMQGSAALDMCLVANGSLDASIVFSNNPWDMQAGVLMVREAGGSVVDSSGVPHSLSSQETFCGNSALLDMLLELLQK